MKITATILTLFATLILFCNADAADKPKKFGVDISTEKIDVSANDFSSKNEELITYLKTALKDYYVVSKEDWTLKYNHVATSDASGSITWGEDKSKVWTWLVRPGGLATVTDENGFTTYLAKVVN